MPIYEYRCTGCSRKFERIVLRGKELDEAICPRCGSRNVERLISSFAMSGVSRKSEESFDDDFDAPDDDFEDDLGDEDLGEDDLDAGGGLGGDEEEDEEDEDALAEKGGDDALEDDLEDEDME